MLTPRTQENFRRIDKEFDHLIHTNQVPAPPPNLPAQPAAVSVMPSNMRFYLLPFYDLQTPLGSAPPNVPSVMPVTVPVGMAASPGTVHQQIQQHLQSQLEGQKMAALSATSIPSVSSNSTLFSPQRYSLMKYGTFSLVNFVWIYAVLIWVTEKDGLKAIALSLLLFQQ